MTEIAPRRTLLVCRKRLEEALRTGPLPASLELRHFNDITGENRWNDIGLVIVVGRTLPSRRTIERLARVIFGDEVQEVPADEAGYVRYPLLQRGIRLRDGRGIAVMAPCHPDSRVEEVRWAICEAQLLQSIGRGRGVNRTAGNPLQLDILTNIVLPAEIDEVTTWGSIRPSLLRVMRAEGAVPVSYADMAAAYPALFPSSDAARMAICRENPEQTPMRYLIEVCSGFLVQRYRRLGSRGAAGMLLYDGARIDPLLWLNDRLGPMMLQD